MKAALIHDYGGPDVLTYGDAPDPIAAPEDLLVEVKAVGVNPADYKFRRGDFSTIFPKPMPHILGMDVAGVVRAVGAAVTGFTLGERVMAMVPYTHHGGYAEQVAAPSAFFVPMPDGLDFVEAAALPTPAFGGMQMVEEDLDIGAGDRVIVTGVTGNPGRYAAYAAKQRGAHVTAAVRGRHARDVRWADEILVMDAAGDPSAPADHDFIADTVGGSVARALLSRLRPGGVLSTISTIPIGDVGGLDVIFRRFRCHFDTALLSRVAAAAASGAIAPPPLTVLSLAEAAQAHRLVESEQARKVVLVP